MSFESACIRAGWHSTYRTKSPTKQTKDAPGCLAHALMDGWTRGATEPGERLRLERIGSTDDLSAFGYGRYSGR